MPLMMVWPDSSSVWIRKDGSSAASFCKPTPSFSTSTFVFGSMAIEMTGSGKIIFSSKMGRFSSQSVSPVRVSLRPTAA